MNKKFDRRNFVKLSTSGTFDNDDPVRKSAPGESILRSRSGAKNSGLDS